MGGNRSRSKCFVLRNRKHAKWGMTMPEFRYTNAEHQSPSNWQAGVSRLTVIARDLVGYTIEEVERELILESLDQYLWQPDLHGKCSRNFNPMPA